MLHRHVCAQIQGGVDLLVHAGQQPVGEDLGEGVDRLHRIRADGCREDAAVHDVEVGDLVARQYVPNPLPRRDDAKVGTWADLVCRLQVRGREKRAVGYELQIALHQVGLPDVRQIRAAHRIEIRSPAESSRSTE